MKKRNEFIDHPSYVVIFRQAYGSASFNLGRLITDNNYGIVILSFFTAYADVIYQGSYYLKCIHMLYIKLIFLSFAEHGYMHFSKCLLLFYNIFLTFAEQETILHVFWKCVS